MTKKNGGKPDSPLQEKSEPDALEKEIEDLIDREKTKNRIVGKLLNQRDSKKNRDSNN